MTTTPVTDVTQLTDLELMEQMTNAGMEFNGLERQMRQAMVPFQQRSQALRLSMDKLQTEINTRIAKKNGTDPVPAAETLSAVRKAQQQKNIQEKIKTTFPAEVAENHQPDAPPAKKK